jgi:hypothetical protein
MRTTITIDDQLLAQAKQRAAATGRTLSQTIEDALRESLLREHERPSGRFSLTPWHGGRPLAGVDLDNNSALLDLMEGRR